MVSEFCELNSVKPWGDSLSSFLNHGESMFWGMQDMLAVEIVRVLFLEQLRIGFAIEDILITMIKSALATHIEMCSLA